ncbi:MAG TPA: hypothetical protein VFV84_13680 [Burkholderiales bacterium]|nr:hypothetical protein [Burkholderiales bacterium]
MNAYEIEQIEKDVRANFQLPLSYQGWADVEREAREERARVIGQGFANVYRALTAKLAALGRQIRSTAAQATDARLHHG